MDYCWVDPGCPAFVGICLAWSVFCRLFGCWLAGVMPVLHPIDVDLRLLNVVRKYIFSEFLSWFCCSGFNLFMPEFIYLWQKIKQKSDTWIAAGFSFVYFRVKWSGPVATEKNTLLVLVLNAVCGGIKYETGHDKRPFTMTSITANSDSNRFKKELFVAPTFPSSPRK